MTDSVFLIYVILSFKIILCGGFFGFFCWRTYVHLHGGQHRLEFLKNYQSHTDSNLQRRF
ncbi:MAG: hypothetical protein RR306_01330 [Clostridia bacterium]